MTVSGEYTYYRLNYLMRSMVSILKKEKYSYRKIANFLGVHHTTISREIKRNSYIRRDEKYYDPRIANEMAEERKRKVRGCKILKSRKLIKFIHSMLKGKWSPDAISGTLRRFKSKYYVSHETIYKFIYKCKREWIKLLARGHRKRYRRIGKYKNRRKVRIPGRVSIDERPKYVENRNVFGHFEADLVVSRKSKAAILVMIERKTRLIKLEKVHNKKAVTVKNKMINSLKNYSNKVKSITYDNGLENVYHEQVNLSLGCKSYFCNPYHSWEKGSVENANGILRRFIPKKTDLSKITKKGLQRIEKVINNRPRKLLNYYTPKELFVREVVH